MGRVSVPSGPPEEKPAGLAGLSDLWALRPHAGLDYCFIIIFLTEYV